MRKEARQLARSLQNQPTYAATNQQPSVTTEIRDITNSSRDSNFDNVFLDLPSDANDRLSKISPPSMSRVGRDLNLSQIELPRENISART